MADNKKYYYMRLKENFFDSNEVSVLEAMPDGYLYSNILLKLYLRSLRDEGRLAVNGIVPYSSEMISAITRHPVETVQKALDTFKALGLIEILDSGVIYMLHIQEFIGTSSTEADRKRAYRQRIESERLGQMSGQTYTRDRVRERVEIERNNTQYNSADAQLSPVVRYFFQRYEQHTGEKHPFVSQERLEEIQKVLEENDADEYFVDEYFGDEEHRGLCGDSDCRIYHFASPVVLKFCEARIM